MKRVADAALTVHPLCLTADQATGEALMLQSGANAGTAMPAPR